MHIVRIIKMTGDLKFFRRQGFCHDIRFRLMKEILPGNIEFWQRKREGMDTLYFPLLVILQHRDNDAFCCSERHAKSSHSSIRAVRYRILLLI